MNRLLITFAALGTAALAGEWNRFKEDFHFTFQQGPGGRLDLESFNGSVEIMGWDQNTVDVSGTKYAEDEAKLRTIRADVTQSGNAVRVRTERPEPHNWNGGARYVIRVPVRTELTRIRTSNGSLQVENIEGQSELVTSNGRVRLRNLRGRVDARTSNGGVEVQTAEGGIIIKTSNGGITLDNVRGSLQATTSNGGIRGTLADSAPNEPIRLATSNGPIDMKFQLARNNDIIASTSNGSITMRLPPNTGARLEARTSSHDSIATDFDIQLRGILSKSRIEGTIGGGGPLLQLTTSNGAIRILRL